MKKVGFLARIKTIRLLTKYRFNIQTAPEDTETKLTEALSEKVLKTTYEGGEIKNKWVTSQYGK